MSDFTLFSQSKANQYITYLNSFAENPIPFNSYIKGFAKDRILSLQIIIRNSNYHISSLVGPRQYLMLTISECILYDVPKVRNFSFLY